MKILDDKQPWPLSKLSGEPELAIDMIASAKNVWREQREGEPTHIAIPIEFKRTITRQFEDSFSVKIERGCPDEICGLLVLWTTEGAMEILMG